MPGQAMHIRQPPADETLHHGQKNIATAGVAEALVATSTPSIEVLIQAKRTNTGRIYVGGASVPNDDTAGIYLSASQSLPLSSQNLNQIFINATQNNDGVTYIYW